MTPQALTDALRRLEAAGWPVFVFKSNPNVIVLEWPDHYNPGPLHIERQFHQAAIKGWLEIQLEARGYRREVTSHLNLKKVQVQIIKVETRAYVFRGGFHYTEIEALIEACLAVVND